MPRLADLDSIETAEVRKLNRLGIHTTERLLSIARTRAGRADLARETGIPASNFLPWVQLADLMRIPGIGLEYCRLLKAARVSTIAELRGRKAERLHPALAKLNARRRIVRRLPPLSEVSHWIEAAKLVEPLVTS